MSRLLELNKINKFFGPLQALKNFSFEINSGEIVGLVGENGAGKSTAMNIAYGLYSADSGEVRFNGQKVNFRSPSEARAAGIGMVHQHFMLSARHSVFENVLLSMNQPPQEWIQKKKILEQLDAKAKELGFSAFPWDQKIEKLSVGEQQQVEIFKALLYDPKLLILDEPTAVLTPQEVQNLFTTLRRFKAQGTSMVIITHKLKEIMKLTDRVYVVRHGQNVVSRETSKITAEDLAAAMVGQRLQSPSRPGHKTLGENLLEIQKLQCRSEGHQLKIDQFQIRKGEIVGVAGVEGNGQDLLIQCLLSPKSQRFLSGRLIFTGQNLTGFSTDQILNLGLRSLPEDRLRRGVLPEASALENFVLGYQKSFRKGFFMNWTQAKETAQKYFELFDVRPPRLDLTFKNFSGGNQQKIVVARELREKPRFLLAAHPTRGVDLHAARFIRERIKEVSGYGAAMVISSDLDELFEMCDRIVVLYKGSFISEFTSEEFNEEKIGQAMAGCAP